MAQHNEKMALTGAWSASDYPVQPTGTPMQQLGGALKTVGGIAKDTVMDYPRQFNTMYAPVGRALLGLFQKKPQHPNRPGYEISPLLEPYKFLTTPAPRGISAPSRQRIPVAGGLMAGTPDNTRNTYTPGKVIPGTAGDLWAGHGHYINKAYNPFSKAWKEPVSDWTERGLTAAGQVLTGGGAATLAAVYGIPAAATGLYTLGGTTLAQSALAGAGLTGGAGATLYGMKKMLYDTPPTAEAAAAAVKANVEAAAAVKADTAAANAQTGKSMLQWGGLGLAGAGGATALYYLMHRRRKQQEEKRRRERAMAGDNLKFSADENGNSWQDLLNKAYTAIGSSVNSAALFGDGTRHVIPGGIMGGGTLLAMPLIAGTAGILGAHHLVNSREKKYDADAAAAAALEAKKDYMRALSGDKAASLDAAYEKYAAQSKVAADPLPQPPPEATANWGNLPLAAAQYLYAGSLLSGAAGLGIGAHVMYNKTKKRLAANNLSAAAETRARLRALPAPWIDPAGLAELQQNLRESKS